MTLLMNRFKLLSAAIVAASLSSSSAAVISSVKDLNYDREDRLERHVILYPANAPKDCVIEFPEIPYGFEMHRVKDEALSEVFGGRSDCAAVCLERGTHKDIAGHVMPHKRYDPSRDGTDFAVWAHDNCQKVEVCLMNYHNKESPLQLMWVPPTGPSKLHLEIEYGERKTRCFHSFIGHKFEAVDKDSGEVVGRLTIEYTLVLGFGESPPSDNPGNRNFEAEVKRDLHVEWRKQGKVSRTFSPLGFKKGKLPLDVFASMGAFYYNNRGNKVREEWKNKGVFVNWWETEVFMIQIPWGIRDIWALRLLELVEAWAGVEVEQTVIYGLRQYETGARLLTHVDRQNTHAVSLIVNIAQGNLTEPWPVEVHDHAGRLHEVLMQPGDIVYYESAKCLHGRNRPMMGENAYYVNLFTHYRPRADADGWHSKPNPEGVPEPVLDVKGECRLVPAGIAETSQTHQVGLVQAVQCDDERLGNTLSPAFFTATSGDDLISWWKRTAPPGAVGYDPSVRDDPNTRDEL